MSTDGQLMTAGALAVADGPVHMTMSVAARSASDPLNGYIAAVLDETARMLEQQHVNVFRARVYRNAAATVRGLPQRVDAIVDAEGLAGLAELPAVGQAMARVIDRIATTGHFPLLERLRCGSTRIAQLVSLPGSATVAA